jgi:UrcA family protein
MKFRPLILAAAAATALASGPSFAQNSVEVQYSDLDLTTAHGKEVLQRRINAAAKEMCSVGEIRTGTILQSQASRKCYKQALADINARFAVVIDKAAAKGG